MINHKDEMCVSGDNTNGELGTGDKKDVFAYHGKKYCSPLPGAVTPYGVKGHQECDVDQGEVYNADSSAETDVLAACKKACQAEPRCQSITYNYETKACS